MQHNPEVSFMPVIRLFTPESYSSVENGRKYYLRKYYFYISMEILLGENGQLGAFPDLLFEYFQIICPWKYYGAKTDLFNIGIL